MSQNNRKSFLVVVDFWYQHAVLTGYFKTNLSFNGKAHPEILYTSLEYKHCAEECHRFSLSTRIK